MRAVSVLRGLSVRVRGTVQGVGFRPFVFGLAERHDLTGWVRNASGQVEIEVDGSEQELARFLTELRREAPPLARIDEIDAVERPPESFDAFRILHSENGEGWQPVPADTATCAACLEELFDPTDRRYRYPFINCTHCGPRFTIIEALPYDRHRTTMRSFPMCEECRAEYEDPRDRRFHAQPVACPVCGPKLWLHIPDAPSPPGDPIEAAAEMLARGKVLAMKGLGGYQLACDARNEDAVAALRGRKRRYGKPFALMVPDLSWAERVCHLTGSERSVLTASERPIVLLARRREDVPIADGVAPGLNTLGIMLPYTPIHHLLLRCVDAPLVMTSGNLSEEPIAIGNWEALRRLGEIGDAFLLHDRDIYARYDDSVVRVMDDTATSIRRARGYAPEPIRLPFRADREILACGGQQKNTFCLVKEGKAFLSQHIGDLENVETLDHFRETLELYRRLFHVEPEVVAHDLHPDYLSTRFAHDYALDAELVIGVQHHHAHVVSGMIEHGLRDPVIGVAFDGTGYGLDRAIWGGEFLITGWRSFQRVGHLGYVPMLGGEAAIRKPYRMTLGYLWELGECDEVEFGPFLETVPAAELRVLRRQFETRLNAPLTSSCGRLFDAVAALLGVRAEASYEGQPAVELEALADPDASRPYPFETEETDHGWIIGVGPVLQALWRDLRSGVPVPRIAGGFHATVSAFTVDLCRRIRDREGLGQVVLTGGCYQNALLTRLTVAGLSRAGFEVYTHGRVPPNDGGLSLGQAVVAHALVASAGN